MAAVAEKVGGGPGDALPWAVPRIARDGLCAGKGGGGAAARGGAARPSSRRTPPTGGMRQRARRRRRRRRRRRAAGGRRRRAAVGGMALLRAASRMPQLRGLLAARALLDMSVMFVHSTSAIHGQVWVTRSTRGTGWRSPASSRYSPTSSSSPPPPLAQGVGRVGAADGPLRRRRRLCGLRLVSSPPPSAASSAGWRRRRWASRCALGVQHDVTNRRPPTRPASSRARSTPSSPSAASPRCSPAACCRPSRRSPRAGAVPLSAAPPPSRGRAATLKKGWLRGGRE